MTDSNLIAALLLTPLIAGLACFAMRWAGRAARPAAVGFHLIAITLVLVFAGLIIGRLMADGPVSAFATWFYVDGLGAIFLALVGLVGFLTGLYAIGYMHHEVKSGEIDGKTLATYYGFFNLFLFTMLLAVTGNNIIMMWVAIEATTLGSTFLVGIYGQRSSLEAAWKYVIICTVGVAFGLYGTVLMYANAAAVLSQPDGAIFWTVLLNNAQALDPTLVHIAFVFVLIGFGTKAGLFPMHAWLPDAHSEAPSPTSAMLSAVLLNCALLVILRYYIVVAKAIGPAFPQTLLLVFGMMSIAVAALFIIVQRDMKRLLAYSSVENMGLIAVALGLGGPLGVLAGLLHVVNHSLAKALLFCGSGNVLIKYGTRDLDVVKGLLKVAPISAVLLAGGALALAGVPPFNVFLSEFLTVTAGIGAGHTGLMVVCLLLLTIVLAGLVRMVAGVVLGPSPAAVPKGELGVLTVAPMAVLLILMLVMGTHIPQPVARLLDNAAGIVLDNGGVSVAEDLTLPWLHPTGQPANLQAVASEAAPASGN